MPQHISGPHANRKASITYCPDASSHAIKKLPHSAMEIIWRHEYPYYCTYLKLYFHYHCQNWLYTWSPFWGASQQEATRLVAPLAAGHQPRLPSCMVPQCIGIHIWACTTQEMREARYGHEWQHRTSILGPWLYNSHIYSYGNFKVASICWTITAKLGSALAPLRTDNYISIHSTQWCMYAVYSLPNGVCT